MSNPSLHFGEQPVLRFGVTANLCRCEIRVNDVPVYQDRQGRAMKFDMPVNEWLYQGRNTLEIRLRTAPPPGDPPAGADRKPLAARASFSLYLRHKRNKAPLRALTDLGFLRFVHAEEGKHLLAPLPDGVAAPAGPIGEAGDDPASEPDPDQPVPDKPKSPPEPAAPGAWTFVPAGVDAASTTHLVILKATLDLPPSWPACPWRDAQPFPPEQAAHYALRQLTGNLHHILTRRDLPALEKLLAPKLQRFQDAYHLGGADVLGLTGVRDRLRDPRYTVAPLPADYLLVTGGGERVGRLLDPATGLPALRLQLPDAPDLFLDFLWTMLPSGWAIVA